MTNPQSFSLDADSSGVGAKGEIAHQSLVDHTERLARRLWTVTEGVWCLVGNGLSNQIFVEGPEGVIAIDTGECREEMAAAIAELRTVTDRPIVAVIYTHFHYTNGTAAILDDSPGPLPIWGHEGIEGNLARMGTEVGPVARRGLIEQFGIDLPADGPDGLLNVGLGLGYRFAQHAPFTPGFLPPDHLIAGPMVATIAGLEVDFRPAPSDADDNVTIWFPSKQLCVNNIVWPALFNVFPIRGEEYRDPRVLLEGVDHIVGLEPEHLVCAHGPPLSGRERINVETVRYRDSIQFLWDQTVRGINLGQTSAEIGNAVRLPDVYASSYFTQMHYGLAEHHVRQIHAGLRGWFDGDPANLFPLPPVERAKRLVQGFGGPDTVRTACDRAIEEDDIRWAIELAGWLVRLDETSAADRQRLATALRTVGQRTTSANIRSWALTRARELEGSIDLSRHRRQTFGVRAALALHPRDLIAALRVRVDPDLAVGIDAHLGFDVADHGRTGLHLRHSVAVPTDGEGADAMLELDRTTLAELVAERITLADAVAAGRVSVVGDQSALEALGRVLGLEALLG